MKRIFLLITFTLLPLALVARSPRPVGINVARTFPYSMVGQLTFFSGNSGYVGSGTVVQPFGVLTAGHNLYDGVGGWSTDLVFKRSHHNNSDLSVRTAARSYILSGYQSNVQLYGTEDVRTFARDTGGLTFQLRPAAGGYLGWTTNTSVLTTTTPKGAFGYGAEVHSGEELLVVGATPFHPVYSTFYESDNTQIEAGMSGGPIIATLPDGTYAQCGVVVSGSEFPVTGGIRVLNTTVSDFILKYLIAPTR